MKASLRTVSPLTPAGPDLAAALAFYTTHMGFTVEWQTETGAGIRRDDVVFLLVANDNENWAENTSFSIGVTGLDALYEEYRDIPANVGPLEVKSWGRREFHMIVPSSVCLQFYEQSPA
jgi:catechol 2,3-dioxygenase-like lactoylglutathione lyase family enzyme